MEESSMRLGKCTAQNFGSYDKIEFDFNNLGLTIIQGSTGSGKSTIFDLPCWILYGTTAKGGTVDEVRSWNSEEMTTGTLNLTTKSNTCISVHRTRGNSTQNDLFYVKNESPIRGINIKETQQLLNDELGVDYRLYSYASYLSEFSPSCIFFNTNAKNRKQLLESLTDLSMANQIQEKAKNQYKSLKFEFDTECTELNHISSQLTHTYTSKKHIEEDTEAWKDRQKRLIENLKAQSESFEKDRQKKYEELKNKSYQEDKRQIDKSVEIEAQILEAQEKLNNMRTDPCDKCGRMESESLEAKQLKHKLEFLKLEKKSIIVKPNKYAQELKSVLDAENHIPELLNREESKPNPFESRIDKLTEECLELKNKEDHKMEVLTDIQMKMDRLEAIETMCANAKQILLVRSIESLQSLTNHYLQTYFDGEFTVKFDIIDQDKLDVVIYKSGNLCTYTQLSKGQRGLLKLAFSVAVMKTSANNIGTTFDTIFLDESLDGLDTNLKIKAIGMLQELASQHSTVLIIDHSTELKASIDNSIYVTLNHDRSQLE